MVIRSDQMKVFEKAGEEIFVIEASAYLVEHHGRKRVTLPASTVEIRSLARSQLHDMVRIGIRRATCFGLVSRSALISFLVTMFLTAPNFDEYPVVRSILKNRGIEPGRRMDEVFKRTSDPDWIAIRRTSNSGVLSPFDKPARSGYPDRSALAHARSAVWPHS